MSIEEVAKLRKKAIGASMGAVGEKAFDGRPSHSLIVDVFDEGNGEYTCSYTPTMPGAQTLKVFTKSDSGTQHSRWSVIVAGTVDRIMSAVSGQGLVSGIVGSSAHIVVSTKDSCGAPIELRDFEKSLTVSTSDSTHSAIICGMTNVAQYAVEYTTPTKAGPFPLSVQLRGEHFKGSPFTVAALPGTIDPTRCVVSGDGLLSARAFSYAHFDLTPVDSYGNVVHTEAEAIAAEMHHERRAIALEFEKGEGDRNFRARYLPIAAGDYQLHVTICGQPTKGSPYLIVVKHGPEASFSTADIPTQVVVGTASTITLTTKSKSGQVLPVADVGSLLEIHVSSDTLSPTLHSNEPIAGSNGVYSLKFRAPTVAGPFCVSLSLCGKDIAGGPYQVIAVPSRICPSKCRGLGAINSGILHAYMPSSVLVQGCDEFGNLLHVGGATLIATLSIGNESAVCAVTDRGDGTYSVSYIPRTAGDHQLSVKIGDIGIEGSPCCFRVAPGTEAESTIASGQGLEHVVAGELAQFLVTTKAVTGEALPLESLSSLRVQDPTKTGKCTDTGEVGVYEVSYTAPLRVGDFSVEVALRGKPIRGSAFTVHCSAGPVHPPM